MLTHNGVFELKCFSCPCLTMIQNVYMVFIYCNIFKQDCRFRLLVCLSGHEAVLTNTALLLNFVLTMKNKMFTYKRTSCSLETLLFLSHVIQYHKCESTKSGTRKCGLQRSWFRLWSDACAMIASKNVVFLLRVCIVTLSLYYQRWINCKNYSL